MADGRKCCVYLPNERKLELTLQPKILGKDLLDIVAAHFKLKEKEYFGIAYKTEGGYYSWLQDEKKVMEHDIAKKSSGVIDFQYAVKFFVESVSFLKQSRTVELMFLHVRSLVYKGQLEIEDGQTAFQLAAYVLQAQCGDYSDDALARSNLAKLPLLPSKVLRQHPKQHCENAVLSRYKEIKGFTKGKAIVRYMTLVESLPTYGVHYYKAKDKVGVAWWLGLSYKGIHQYHLDDRITPLKTYHWHQLENLYFREKKFSIEVNDRQVRKLSAGSKERLLVDSSSRKPSPGEVKVHAWYGSPALIKSIWIMSISQHHYYLDRKQSKTKLYSASNLTNLSNGLTANSSSLITPLKETPRMTHKQIKDVSVTVKRGSQDETPEVRAAKQEMTEALKSRRTELEDRLFDKVNELKKLCLQEAEIIGHLPAEYIRYMDRDEKRPKVKKRIGAEFKVKLRHKSGNKSTTEKDYPTSVTAASSSSSGFGSEAADTADELSQLETEFEILTQIANAAKKLASDPSAKGRKRNKRLDSYKKTLKKLQVVEDKINVLRKKNGQKPSERASMFIDDSNGLVFEDGRVTMPDGTESERSSLSDALLLDDDTSLSSGGDALSTHSTPAALSSTQTPQHPSSTMVSRRNRSPADIDMNEVLAMQRSVTPPPSFDRGGSADYGFKKHNHVSQHPTSRSPNKVHNGSNRTAQPTRNWIANKWDYHRSKSSQGWHESSLDSLDTTSSGSRLSAETRSPEHERTSPLRNFMGKIKVPRPLDPSVAQEVDLDNDAIDDRASSSVSANSNHNNHNLRVSSSKSRDAFNMAKLSGELSDSPVSELSTKSNPPAPSSQHSYDSDTLRREGKLAKIDETHAMASSARDRFRKRSSSFTETRSQSPYQNPHRNAVRKKSTSGNPALAGDGSPRRMSGSPSAEKGAGGPQAAQFGTLPHSHSANELQPPIFDTNLNIRMQYLTRSSGHLSLVAPGNPTWTQASGQRNPAPLRRQNSAESSSGPYFTGIPEATTTTTASLYPADPRYGTPPITSPAVTGTVPSYYASQVYRQVYSPDGRPPPYDYVESQYQEPMISNSQRDYLNQEVYNDISMGWVPSLYDYSSRASVCESASAQSKKEDIRRLLEEHIASRKPSNASSYGSDRKKSDSRPEKENPRAAHGTDLTWAEYQKRLLVGGISSGGGNPPNGHPPPASGARTSIFQHKPAPSQNMDALTPYKTHRQPKYQNQKSVTASAYSNATGAPGFVHAPSSLDANADAIKHRQLIRHYMHHDHADPLDHVMDARQLPYGEYPGNGRRTSEQQQQQFYPYSAVPANPTAPRQHPPTQRWLSDESKSGREATRQSEHLDPRSSTAKKKFDSLRRASSPVVKSNRSAMPGEDTDASTVVIQALTKSPEGHAVSLFTVAKSAPSTPLPQRQNCPAFFGDLPSDVDGDWQSRAGTLKYGTRRQSAEDLLNSQHDDTVAKLSDASSVIVHTPSFKTRVKPPMGSHGPIDTDSFKKPSKPEAFQLSSESSEAETRGRAGRSTSRNQPFDPDFPKPPPRVKRAASRSRLKAAEANGKRAPSGETRPSTENTKKAPENTATPGKNNKDVNGNDVIRLKPPPARRSDLGKPPPSRRSPMNASETPPPVQPVILSGTLPRASRSRRKADRSGASTPVGTPPSRMNFGADVTPTPNDLTWDRNSRRPAQLGFLLHEQNDPSSAPTTPTGSPLPRRRHITYRQNAFPPVAYMQTLSDHHRSKSEAWKVGVNGLPLQSGKRYQFAADSNFMTQPRGYYPADYYQCDVDRYRIMGSNPNSARYPVELEHQRPATLNRSRRRGQLSASAEDLLWTDTNDGQAGTLV